MGLEQVSPLISVTYGFRTGVTTNLHHTLNLPVSLINLIVDKSIKVYYHDYLGLSDHTTTSLYFHLL